MEKMLRDYFDKKIENYNFRGNTDEQEKVEDLIDDSIEQAMDILRLCEKRVDDILEDLEADCLPTRMEQYFDWYRTHEQSFYEESMRG